MTAPARTRRKSSEPARVATPPPQTPATERRTASRRTSAAERAYARRAQRVEGLRRAAEQPERTRRSRLRWPSSRASFVLVVMLLLAAGVAVTLLLSTQAIADSYRLEQIRQENANLAEQSQQLQEDVSNSDSASSLAARAKALGMVPAGEPAHLVQNPDGSVTVVGTPEKVTPPAPPPPPASPPPSSPASSNPPAANGQTTGMPVEGDAPQSDPQSSAPPSQQTTPPAVAPGAGQ
jgi:cell division protein FtsB